MKETEKFYPCKFNLKMGNSDELKTLLRHNKDDDYVTMAIFIVALLVCMGTFGMMIFNVAAALDDGSSKSCENYMNTQKITSFITIGLAVLGFMLLVCAYFRAERKLGRIRGTFSEDELPIW